MPTSDFFSQLCNILNTTMLGFPTLWQHCPRVMSNLVGGSVVGVNGLFGPILLISPRVGVFLLQIAQKQRLPTRPTLRDTKDYYLLDVPVGSFSRWNIGNPSKFANEIGTQVIVYNQRKL